MTYKLTFNLVSPTWAEHSPNFSSSNLSTYLLKQPAYPLPTPQQTSKTQSLKHFLARLRLINTYAKMVVVFAKSNEMGTTSPISFV